MKTIIITLIFLLGINIYAEVVKSPTKKGKSLNTIFINNKGNCYETRNGGFSYNEIPCHTAKYLTDDIRATKSDNIDDRIVSMYPNPITNNSTLQIELKDRAGISVYSYDSQNNKVAHFEGIGEKGINSIQIEADKHTNGILILYIEINGKTSFFKAIVAK